MEIDQRAGVPHGDLRLGQRNGGAGIEADHIYRSAQAVARLHGRQCAATSLSCHGWIAVNRAHESEVQRWYSKKNADILSVVECTGPKDPKPAAVCRIGTCVLK